jgi:hypothetical protein
VAARSTEPLGVLGPEILFHHLGEDAQAPPRSWPTAMPKPT